MKFTKEQQAVIEHVGSHALVSAVAGSGKTSTLEARIRTLLNRGVEPQKVLVLTFNRSVRYEMKSRLSDLIEKPSIHTFHSLGKREIDRYHTLQRTETWPVESNDYIQEQLARSALRDISPSFSDSDFKAFGDLLSELKAAGRFPKEVNEGLEFEELETWKKNAFEQYEKLRIRSKKRFREDLVYDLLYIIRARPEWFGNRYQHVLVDEYQDINRAQQEMLSAAAGTAAEIMVVGDPDQCIYEWRGSRPDFITNIFEREFSGVKRFFLSKTFRFGHQVSLAANCCIRHNKDRIKSMCISGMSAPATELHFSLTDSEAVAVVSILKELRSKGIAHNEIALLVRAYGHSVGTELLLLQQKIPYKHGKGKPLAEREEIQVLGCLLSILISDDLSRIEAPYRTKALRSLLRLSRSYLRSEELDKLSCLADEPVSNWLAIVDDAISQGKLDKNKRKNLQAAIQDWQRIAVTNSTILRDASKALNHIQGYYDLESMWEEVSARHIESNDKKRSYRSLLNSISEMNVSSEELFDLLFMGPDASDQSVTITSIHKAKGLEWKAVVVLGLAEGEFPIGKDEDSGNELEEERRLFYVAVTRAKEHLYLLGPIDPRLDHWQQNEWYGSPSKKPPVASRFLYEAELLKSKVVGELLDCGNISKVILGEKDYFFMSYLGKLNNRPRKTLGFQTPTVKLDSISS